MPQLLILISSHLLLLSGYPHGCSVKLNYAAAFKDSNAAFGIVVRDSTGCLCYVLGNRCHDISPIHAKIIVVHSAFSLAYNHGWLNAIVESDSQVAISLSSLESPPPWSLVALVDDIHLWAKNMKGERKCDNLNKVSLFSNNVFGDGKWNGGFSATSKSHQYARQSLYNLAGFPDIDFESRECVSQHSLTDEGYYIPVHDYAEGDAVLDFEDSTVHLVSEKEGSVATQGESSTDNLGGRKQLGLPANPFEPFGYVIQNHSASPVEPYSIDDNSAFRCVDDEGHVILDFENSAVRMPSAKKDSRNLPVFPDMGFLITSDVPAQIFPVLVVMVAPVPNLLARSVRGLEIMLVIEKDVLWRNECSVINVNEVANKMHHFGGNGNSGLDPDIVQGLIGFLDEHNELYYWRPECDLPTSQKLGAIVFESGQDTETGYDVIIQARGGLPQRINKLHPSYMSLQFPLLFVFGQSGFYLEMKQRVAGEEERVSMNMIYIYQVHEWFDSYVLLFRVGRLIQQYVFGVYCCIEQMHIDYYRTHQNDIRKEYMSGVYDAISRGDHEGSTIGSQIILPMSFTGGPR
ncbi:DNA helicase [Tanacetum coccineum]